MDEMNVEREEMRGAVVVARRRDEGEMRGSLQDETESSRDTRQSDLSVVGSPRGQPRTP